jgi:hypothetical protein
MAEATRARLASVPRRTGRAARFEKTRAGAWSISRPAGALRGFCCRLTTTGEWTAPTLPLAFMPQQGMCLADKLDRLRRPRLASLPRRNYHSGVTLMIHQKRSGLGGVSHPLWSAAHRCFLVSPVVGASRGARVKRRSMSSGQSGAGRESNGGRTRRQQPIHGPGTQGRWRRMAE